MSADSQSLDASVRVDEIGNRLAAALHERGAESLPTLRQGRISASRSTSVSASERPGNRGRPRVVEHEQPLARRDGARNAGAEARGGDREGTGKVDGSGALETDADIMNLLGDGPRGSGLARHPAKRR